MLSLPAGKTFTQLGKELGLTNAYTAQLFYNQVSSQFPACRLSLQAAEEVLDMTSTLLVVIL